ncbi:MAG: amidohydrolase family protein [Gemmatimonadetes bacterium]|nr:amidohydrolase family protein [Gemmatimonadota bacterium]
MTSYPPRRAHCPLLCRLAILAAITPLHLGGQSTPTWSVDNHGRRAGDLTLAQRGDTAVARWLYTDRNRGGRVETRLVRALDGSLRSAEQRTIDAEGRAGTLVERLEVVGDSVRITGANGTTRAIARTPDLLLTLRTGTPLDAAELARTLLARPDGRGTLLSGASARAEVALTLTLDGVRGRPRARFVVVTVGTQPDPTGVWLDDRGALLATDVQWFITVREDVRPQLPVLRRAELAWRAARGEALAARVRSATSGTLVIANGDLFDADAGTLRPRQTMVIRGDRIVAVGDASTIAVPAGATVIDAAGKTVMPGMWDMHGHLQVASQSGLGVSQLANGITTSRDLASDLDVATSIRDREAAGRLAAPRAVLGGFIEGPLAWAGPSEAIVRDEAEARAWVARYDSLGYVQIKLYNVVHPDLVPVIAAEAKRRGMRLSGHIPRGMSVAAAVALGYDEIQHAAFLLSDFFPDSLYLPRMRAYSQVATAVAPTFDADGAGMTRLIATLRAHGTAVDGTFNLWIGGGGALVGAGGSPDLRRADSTYLRIIQRLYAAGVPLIAGTDNSSSSTFRRELEMYELAGLPRTKILQIATIDAARHMRQSEEYGSLAVGKVADLLIVDGRPTERIGDLAKLETVVRGGRLYQVRELRTALGSSGAAGAEGDDPAAHPHSGVEDP